MTLLAGFLDVLLRGLGAVGLSAAVGGLVYLLVVLRPWSMLDSPGPDALAPAARRRALRLIAAGALVVAGSEALLLLVVHPWALADETGRWPLRAFLTTEFGLAGSARVGLALALGVVARRVQRTPDTAGSRAVALGLGALLMANAAWLAHAVSRLHDRGSLMLGTVLHQLGAVIWVGGVIHLVAFATLWRRAAVPAAAAAGVRVLARFSGIALVGIALVLGPGLYLSWSYIGSWSGLIGTGYGVMVLTKAALLGCALVLGGLNFLLLRRIAGGPSVAAVAARVPVFVEAEVGIGVTLLLAAASLTSLPPAVDVVVDRATPAEVVARFVPKMPRLTSPPVAQLLAAAAPIDDTLAKRQPEEYAWSEYNHHSAGFFVLLMGLLALLDRTGRVPWARHWPLGFLGLAAFLFVRNDPRAWPLGPAGFWESMVLPDVLQHRMVVLLIVALAVFEWMVRSGRLTRPGGRLVFPLLCAVGGALLLTHSHAMFNLKSEFLAEVSHAPMGLLGVMMAWGRWLELRLPQADARIPGWIWAACMTGIGMILLVYRET
ncbi:MAG TPA: CopD family protein [Candidatus Bathyarchaeia archaeon]|nr:CopD family protein [Candidatus Bathyarchaeia archaeon]